MTSDEYFVNPLADTRLCWVVPKRTGSWLSGRWCANEMNTSVDACRGSSD
jgi:hypothetical protein